MGVTEALYKKNERRCPSCINMIYAGDCRIVATTDAEMPRDLIPPGIPKRLEGGPSGNTATIEKDTILKKSPPKGSLQQTRARMEPEPLIGELYTITEACRICPFCGYHLPANFDTAKSFTIAVVGDVYSGKSHYIAALIKQIQSKQFMRSDQELMFTCLTYDVEQKYITDFFEPLFGDKKRKIQSTQKFQETTHKPLIYELTIRASKERPSKTLNLTLYDTAGEDYIVHERLVKFSRYVLSADAIIFLADPITMPEIVDRLPADLDYKNAPKSRANDGLEKITASVRRFRGPTGLRSIPIAVTLSKSDLLKYLTPVSGQYNFMLHHEYKGNINLREIEKIDKEVRDFIERYGDRALLHTAASFSKTHFFATSATGYPPDASGTFPAVEPQRCLDPLLWILHELKVIPNDRLF